MGEMGNLTSTRVSIHAQKPTLVILTEACIPEDFQGTKVFRGFYMAQVSRAQGRAGGVAIFAKKEVVLLENTAYNSVEGNYCIGAYSVGETILVLAAIYGPSTNSDREANVVFQEISIRIRELSARVGTETVFMVGDYNIKLDKILNNGKPSAVRTIKEQMEHSAMSDAGQLHGSAPTWRRSRGGQKSRLDYIMFSERANLVSFQLRWGRFDHAELLGEFEIGARREKGGLPVLKDWVLSTERFLNLAPDMVRETLLDHDREMRNKSTAERENFVASRNSNCFESELTLAEPNEGITHAHIFNILLNRVTTLQRRVQCEIVREQRAKLTDINMRIGQNYAKLDELGPGDPREGGLREELGDLQVQLQHYCENRELAGKQRIDNFYASKNGKSAAASFYITKEKRNNRNISRLIGEGGEVITDPAAIAECLQNNYCRDVETKFVPTRSLEDFMREHAVTLPSLSEEQREGLEADVTTDELRDALSSARAESSPGPSGQSIAIFKYLFCQVPQLFTKAINELIFVKGLCDSPSLSWLKERKIIYIPKAGKALDRASHFRPLSLLECLYKIQSRILTRRMAGAMEDMLYADQYGFRQGRGTNAAVVPILEAIKDAESNNRSLQILSIDIKCAFDTISPDLIHEVMKKNEYPPIFNNAMHDLTSGGRGHTETNQFKGPSFRIQNGSGQGDPASAGRFNTGSDPMSRAVNLFAAAFQYVFQNGEKLPLITFADDHAHGLNVTSAQQIVDLLSVYAKFAQVSGLKISIEKCCILGINTNPELLREIEEVTGIPLVEGMRYLGLEIRSTYAESKTASFDAINEGIRAKYNRINSSLVDLFHRRQLIQTVIVPSYNHAFMAFGLCPRVEEDLDDKIINLLWTRKKDGRVTQGRRLVAKNRVSASFEMGGLKMSFTAEIVCGLLLNILSKLSQESSSPAEKQTFMYKYFQKILEGIHAPSWAELLQCGGQGVWQRLYNRLIGRSPFLAQLCRAMAKMHKLNDINKDSWTCAPIAGHSLANPIFLINTAESITLAHFGLHYVEQLFPINDLTGRLIMDQDANLGNRLGLANVALLNKCKNLRMEIFRSRLPANIGRSVGFAKVYLGMKWSRVYRRLHREEGDKKFPGPPSYFTRRRDGIPVPSLHLFMKGYTNIMTWKISSKTKETAFLILNRQIWTNQKESWANRGAGEAIVQDSCGLCGERENTQHLLFECDTYSAPLWNLLKEILNLLIDEGEDNHPHITLHAYNIMFNLQIAGALRGWGDQVNILIQEIKRNIIFRRYKRCIGNVNAYVDYDRPRLAAHLMIVVRKLISLRQYQGQDFGTLSKVERLLSTLD